MTLTEKEIFNHLYVANTFHHGERSFRLVFLLPESLWRPLKASWWRGKEVSIIGGDERGNYVLRHCDGSVRLWDHERGTDEVLASSVRGFLARSLGKLRRYRWLTIAKADERSFDCSLRSVLSDSLAA